MDSSQMIRNPDDARKNRCAVISLEDVRSLQKSTKTTEEPGKSCDDNEPRPYPCDCGEGSIRPAFFDGAWRYAVRCQACERKERTRRIRRAIEASGIPERFLGIEINEDIGRAKAILSLRLLIERRGAAVVLMGPTGTGKSLLAAKTAEAWLLVGKSVSWFSEEDYYEAMRPEGKGKDRLTNDLLVVDDLGSGSSTEWARATFELLVCRRYDSMKSMILTTNLGKEQICGRYGERVVSRLNEMASKAGWCMVGGADRRGGA